MKDSGAGGLSWLERVTCSAVGFSLQHELRKQCMTSVDRPSSVRTEVLLPGASQSAFRGLSRNCEASGETLHERVMAPPRISRAQKKKRSNRR
jgi:hypothetical protein